MLRRAVNLVTSLKLTIACLAAAMVLVFAGTLAQVHVGLDVVQERYFRGMFVWWPPDSHGFKFPVFPAGHLIGGVLLINLIAAHIRRFRRGWSKLGIHLIHAGLIIMLAGGLLTDLFAVESHMRLERGETKNYAEHPRLMELVVVDTSDKEYDQVTAIPEAVLRRGGTIEHSSLPFRLVVRHFFQNSRLHMLSEPGIKLTPIADRGPGAQVGVRAVPRAAGINERDIMSTALEIIPTDLSAKSLGTWLVSDALGAPQTFEAGGRSWRLEMRQARYYKPYSVTLQKFTHEKYPGTEIPKNFASSVTLIDGEKATTRDVLIYMNHPLRYRGDTFYQAGFEKGDTTSILQVVHNPGFATPYVACAVVGIGLLVQFGSHLIGFSRKRRAMAV